MKKDEVLERLDKLEGYIRSAGTKPLSVPEAAEYLGISRSTLYKLTSTSAIAHFKSKGGKLISFLKEDLDGWLLAHRVAPMEEVRRKV